MTDRRSDESGGPGGGTRGGYIDSFENMPGAQHQPFGAAPPRAFVPSLGLRVVLSPGPDGNWLAPASSAAGSVIDLIPGQLHEATAVVELEQTLAATGRTGREVIGHYLVIEPAGAPSRWRRRGRAHVEVWSAPPTSEPWLDRAAGVWVDDGAPYEFI